jgi:hypothetical protein
MRCRAQGDAGMAHQDRYEALLSQCESSGASRDDAALGLAVAVAVHGERLDSAAVLDAAEKVRQLRGVGVAPAAAAGALALTNADFDAALNIATT